MPETISLYPEGRWQWAWRHRRVFTSVLKDVLGGVVTGALRGIFVALATTQQGQSINWSTPAEAAALAAVIAAVTLPLVETVYWWLKEPRVRAEEEAETLRDRVAMLERDIETLTKSLTPAAKMVYLPHEGARYVPHGRRFWVGVVNLGRTQIPKVRVLLVRLDPPIMWTFRALRPLNLTGDTADGYFTLNVGDGQSYSEQVEVVEEVIAHDDRPWWRIVYADQELLSNSPFYSTPRCDLTLRLEGDIPPVYLRLRVFYAKAQDRFWMEEVS